MDTLLSGNAIRRAARESVASCIRKTHSDMKTAYGSGIDNARLAGAYNALTAFAENFYINLYGSLDENDFRLFLKECGL